MNRACLSGVFLLACLAGAQITSAAETGTAPSVLPFIQNDYDRALAEARARKVPLFIEAWAPW